MDTKIKVSIAMATYNGAKYLDLQLNSILKQTYSDFELIISDDGSCDETLKIINDYRKIDNRIRIITNLSTSGIVSNFENALKNCKGEYIFLADQDDVWDERKIEILLKRIGHASLLHSDARLINEQGLVLKTSYTTESKKNTDLKSVLDVLLNNPVTGCTCVFKRDLLVKSIPFPKGIPVHDKWLAIIAMVNNGISYHDEQLTDYRQHGNNQIGANTINFKTKLYRFISNLDKIEHLNNEKKQLLLINEIIRNQQIMNNVSLSEKIKLNILKLYYRNLINTTFPVISFIIRCVLFYEFEKKKPITIKFLTMFSVFKVSLIKVVKFFSIRSS